MNDVCVSLEKLNILSNLSAFSVLHVLDLSLTPLLIGSSEEPSKAIHGNLNTSVYETVDNHSLSQSVCNKDIPAWAIVIEGTIEPALKRKVVIREVGIGQNKEETCIEEQRYENTIGDFCELFRVSVITNPCNQTDSNSLDDSVDNNNEASDEVSCSEHKPDIVVVRGTHVA